MKFQQLIIGLLCTTVLSGCNRGLLYEKYMEIDHNGWEYVKPITFEVEVTDVSKPYDFYINLRHTNDYPYSNLWIMLFSYPPEGNPTQQRMELKLAKPDGKWLGNGLGANITHEIKVKAGFTFPMPGKYAFTLQHDMREQIVPAITHVGIRIEEASE
ncbi:gliding motility lipoprotein GldH [bacterium]|nr:gliding motility lipoprotein GldH [bacterium]